MVGFGAKVYEVSIKSDNCRHFGRLLVEKFWILASWGGSVHTPPQICRLASQTFKLLGDSACGHPDPVARPFPACNQSEGDYCCDNK